MNEVGNSMTDLAPAPSGIELKPTGIVFGSISFEIWHECGKRLQQAERSVLWWLGDWLNYGERVYGEKYAQAVDESDYSYQTLRDAKWISASVELSLRKDNLSWNHHRLVAGMEPENQLEWLGRAEADKLSYQAFRKQINDWKNGVKRQRQLLSDAATGEYSVIYADPPWEYSNSGFMGAADSHYLTMPTDEICAEEVAGFAAENAVLFLWATNPLLLDGLRVMEAWGFAYKTNFAWAKEGRSMYGKLGFYNYGRHELLLVGVRGSFQPEGNLWESVISAPKSEHSRKPEIAYEVIEGMYPTARRLEMYQRGSREGWDGFGNESV